MCELTAWQIGVAGYAPQHVRISTSITPGKGSSRDRHSRVYLGTPAEVKRDGKVKVGRASQSGTY